MPATSVLSLVRVWRKNKGGGGALNTDEECTKRKTYTMDSWVRLTHPLRSLLQTCQAGCNARAWGEGCLCQAFQGAAPFTDHWCIFARFFNPDFPPRGWNWSLRTYPLPGSDVKQSMQRNTAAPNCPPFLLKDSAVKSLWDRNWTVLLL